MLTTYKIRIDSTFCTKFKADCQVFNACETPQLREAALRQMIITNPLATLQFIDEADRRMKVERIYKLELN